MTSTHKVLLLLTGIVNLLLFLTGLFMGILHEGWMMLSIGMSTCGLLGMASFAVCWIVRPEILTQYNQEKRIEEMTQMDRIDPNCTESLMKNIRGIPFLIQAIQYSMETTYYRDLMTEMGEGVVRTSVIHTAPACQSILDSQSDEEDNKVRVYATPRHSGAEEQWLSSGERWQNEQLRLSLEGQPTHPTHTLLVFPFRESTSRPVRNEEREEGERTSVRCIAMSTAFLTRLGSRIGRVECTDPHVV